MATLTDLSRDLAREYRITMSDARGILDFISADIIDKIAEDGLVEIDKFGSFIKDEKRVRFRASSNVWDKLGLKYNLGPTAYNKKYGDED